MQFVPADKREGKVPCRFILLNNMGDTVESLYRSATQEELESVLRSWLTRQIETFEDANAAAGKG